MRINGIFNKCLMVFIIISLSACFSPLDYEKNQKGNSTLSVSISGKTHSSPARTAINEDDFLYLLDFYGPEGRHIPKSGIWGETVTVQAVPGTWSIIVKAVDPVNQNILKAVGQTYNIEVKDGERNTASVKMAVYSEAGDWTALKTAVEQGSYDEYIVLTGDLFVLPANSTINLNVDKTITLAAKQDAVIESFGFTGNLFSVSGGGHLIFGVNDKNGLLANSGSVSLNGDCGDAYISVSPFGRFTMNSGVMTGNNSVSGGAVYNEGIFEMNNGIITGNQVTSNGAGVFNAGTFSMSDGQISGNSAVGGASKGGGVFNTGTFAMTGGKLSGNSAFLSGDGIYNDGIFEIAYNASINENNDVYLAQGRTLTITGKLAPASIVLAIPDYTPGRPILSGNAALGGGLKFVFSEYGVGSSVSGYPIGYTEYDVWINSNGSLSGYIVSTLAGNTNDGWIDGPGNTASFSYPRGIAIDSSGNMYVTDDYSRIRKISPDGVVSTLAGNGNSGCVDGPGNAAEFDYLQGIAVDSAGNVFVADSNNYLIRKISPDGVVSTFAGNGNSGWIDGPGDSAEFSNLSDITIDNAGFLYVAEYYDNRIRKISPDGVVSTLAGNGNAGWVDGPGGNAEFDHPTGIAVDRTGNVFVAEEYNHCVRKISPDGMVSTLAGNGFQGAADGPGSSAQFDRPYGIAVDNKGNVYVADTWNYLIRKISPDGYVTTLAGSCVNQAWLDGFAPAALFEYPESIAVGNDGSIYVVDSGPPYVIRKITPGPR